MINIIILIIKFIKKDNVNFKNLNYKIDNIVFVNGLLMVLMFFTVLGIDYYNEGNYNKMIAKQKDKVIYYLNKKYPNYEFEIIRT